MAQRSISLLLMLTVACGGPPSAVRQTVEAAAVSHVAIDAETALLASQAGERCLDASDSWTEYDACMHVWYDAEIALRAARASLLSLERAADAWEAGGEEEWASLAACVAESLERLMSALADAGVDVPEEIATTLGLVRGLGGICRD